MAIVDIRNRVDLQGLDKPGIHYVYMKIDFSKTSLATANDYRVARVGAGYLYLGCFFRMPTDSTSEGTLDVGTTQSGVDLDSAIDVDAGSQTSWQAMTPTYAAPVEQAADGYIWIEANTNPINDGVIEFMFCIQAAPGDDSFVN
jgi:hypothetical protein